MERSNSSWLTVTRFSFCAPVSRGGNTTHLQFVGQNQVVGTFRDSYFLGNFTDS
jgi:hypothetical protein